MATRDLSIGPVEASKQVRQYAADRVCAERTCTIRLSRYNPEHFCGVHAPTKLSLTPRRW
jgi:hypothetical protein